MYLEDEHIMIIKSRILVSVIGAIIQTYIAIFSDRQIQSTEYSYFCM